jgi:uncharacterized phage infection (PIP) family protein YhgE
MAGLTKAVRTHTIWLFIITLVCISITCYAWQRILQIKDNYTDLHRRVTELERICVNAQ